MNDNIKIIRSERIMNDLAKYLTHIDFKVMQDAKDEIKILNGNHKVDGRLESSFLEPLVKNLIDDWIKQSQIAKLYDLYIPDVKIREAYDVLIQSYDEELNLYIDIKIPNLNNKHADNLNFETAMPLLAAGIERGAKGSGKNKSTNKATIFKDMKELDKLNLPPTDIYYLVVDKNDKDGHLFVYYTSILTMKELKPNAKNGLQVDWINTMNKGRTCLIHPTEELLAQDDSAELPRRTYRSFEDSIAYIMSVLRESENKAAILAKNIKKINNLFDKMCSKRHIGDIDENDENDSEAKEVIEENDRGESQFDNNS